MLSMQPPDGPINLYNFPTLQVGPGTGFTIVHRSHNAYNPDGTLRDPPLLLTHVHHFSRTATGRALRSTAPLGYLQYRRNSSGRPTRTPSPQLRRPLLRLEKRASV